MMDKVFINTLDILNFLEEELKGSYFDSKNTRYMDEKILHDGKKSLSVFFRNAYSKTTYYQDNGARELPITIHLLSDSKANRSEFQEEVVKLEHLLRVYTVYNEPPVIRGRRILFLKDFRSVINIGENEYGQMHYSIHINVVYKL